MCEEELLRAFEDILQCEQSLSPDTALSSLEEWDSLAQMGMLAFFDRRLGKTVDFATLGQCATVADILELAR